MVLLPVFFIQRQVVQSCIPACLLMAHKYAFPSTTETEATIAQRCGYVEGIGISFRAAFEAAANLGLSPRWLNDDRIQAEIESAIKLRSPVVAQIKLRTLSSGSSRNVDADGWHTVLIVGIDFWSVFLHDPASDDGGIRISRFKFFAPWVRVGCCAFRVAAPGPPV